MLTDRMAIDLLEQLSEAILRKDYSAVLDMFVRSDAVTMIGSEGPETADGWQELEALWKRVLSRPQRYTWHFYHERITSTEEIACIAADATVVISGDNDEHELPYRITLVVQRLNDDWKIVHYHGSEPARPWI